MGVIGEVLDQAAVGGLGQAVGVVVVGVGIGGRRMGTAAGFAGELVSPVVAVSGLVPALVAGGDIAGIIVAVDQAVMPGAVKPPEAQAGELIGDIAGVVKAGRKAFHLNRDKKIRGTMGKVPKSINHNQHGNESTYEETESKGPVRFACETAENKTPGRANYTQNAEEPSEAGNGVV